MSFLPLKGSANCGKFIFVLTKSFTWHKSLINNVKKCIISRWPSYQPSQKCSLVFVRTILFELIRQKLKPWNLSVSWFWMIFHTQAGCHRCVKAEVVYAYKPGALTPESPTIIFWVVGNCLIAVPHPSDSLCRQIFYRLNGQGTRNKTEF